MLPLHSHRRSAQATPSRWRLPRLSIRSYVLLAVGTLATLFFLGSIDYPPSLSFPTPDIHRPFRKQWKQAPYSPENSDGDWSARADSVKQAMLHAWNGYEKVAWGMDELRPVSNQGAKVFNGWGVTIIDSLDTLLIMDLIPEYQRAVSFIADMKFQMSPNEHAPFFETVIRYLGGLLSAYALAFELENPKPDVHDTSGKPLDLSSSILLSRADDLARGLLPAFNTTSGLPVFGVNPQYGTQLKNSWVLLAEIGSCQMEFKYLARLTGRSEYFDRVDRVTELLQKHQRPDGLFSTYWNIDSGQPANHHRSMGALADSAYEYLLKQFLLSGRVEQRTKDLYVSSINGALDTLLFLSPTRKLLYVTDIDNVTPSGKMEHLSCFFPGLLALGVHLLSPPPGKRGLFSHSASSPYLTEKEAEMHMWAAEGLAHTCATLYADQATGLGPEEVGMERYLPGDWESGRWMKHVEEWRKTKNRSEKPPGVREEDLASPLNGKLGDQGRDYSLRTPTYLLRPETIETYFIMYKVTGDVIWRERGWSAFQALENYTKTKSGYASIDQVYNTGTLKADSMPSYFPAETLKYLYLLFTDRDIIPLDKWVFTTEAHPLPVFEWREWEKKRYRISQ